MPHSAAELATARLHAPPILEVVRQRTLDLLLAGAPMAESVAQIADVDAVLQGLLLRLVRCPMYEGADMRDIDTATALERVGRPVLVHAVTYLPGLPDRQMREVVEQACNDWVHGVAVAAAARWLAGTGEYEDAREAYLAGLLHDVGGRCGHAGADARAAAKRLGERWRLEDRVALVARLHEAVSDGLPPESLVDDGRELDARTRRLLDVVGVACRIAVGLGFSQRVEDVEP